MVSIRIVDPNDPTYQEFLPKDKENALVFAAFDDTLPVGFMISYVYEGIKEAIITSFQVNPGHQNQGIGRDLMCHLIDHLKKLGLHLIHYQFNECPAIEKLLAKTGWEPPVLLMRRYFFDEHSFLNKASLPEWYFSPLPGLPDDFSLFLWSSASSDELETAKDWVRANPEINQYSPFDDRYPFDAKTSLGLRYKGKLAGWMINHRLKPKLLRYTGFYVIPEVRGIGPAVSMLKESIRLHIEDDVSTVGMMEINFKQSSPRWIEFIEKRLEPFTSHKEDMRYAFHYLKS